MGSASESGEGGGMPEALDIALLVAEHCLRSSEAGPHLDEILEVLPDYPSGVLITKDNKLAAILVPFTMEQFAEQMKRNTAVRADMKKANELLANGQTIAAAEAFREG